ncbi:hypothetical protein AB836_01645 [Rickettsiales bacterium (ex Bugula neritina AB1)]|nr:hypothetical protein AB836_01645 [Rickettsiales bacterium (ex Bugula neritina AB1)]
MYGQWYYKFVLRKAVRDLTPQLMEKDSMKYYLFAQDNNQFFESLKKKLLEEAQEVNDAKNYEELKEELADLYIVILEILKRSNINLKDIEETMNKKNQLRGGFKENLFLDYVLIPEYKTNLVKAHQNSSNVLSSGIIYF